MSLFDESGMRKGTKSSLYHAFTPIQNSAVQESCIFVIDGGFLLHRVVWTTGQTFAGICDTYIEYVRSKYKSTAVVIFDGYLKSGQSTKTMERLRRSNKRHSIEIVFSEQMMPTVTQENFLANTNNKKRLISMLMSKFKEAKILCKQAQEDADRLIVVTAKNLASHHSSVTVVGEDVDLLVIMIGLCTPSNVTFLKPGKGKVQSKLYNPKSTIDKTVADHILFLHAMSGCDTTSAVYGQGKVKFLKTLKNNPEIGPTIKVFTDPDADLEDVVIAGENFLLVLYDSHKHYRSLNSLRYRQYVLSAYKVTSNIAALSPTKGAARQHSLRVYYQIQQWLGEEKNPELHGWKSTRNGLMPITTMEPPAPDELLELISCKCKKDCKGNCGCRKSGLYCSKICKNCEGCCTNAEQYDANEDDDAERPDDLTPTKTVATTTQGI